MNATQQERSTLQRSLVGPAGEHFVLYRLHLRGMLASLAPRNAPTVDILVLDNDETVVATIQVKTRTAGAPLVWQMRAKHEILQGPRFFYAFVDLEPEQPVTYIVPSAVVADVIAKSYQTWLATPGMRGKPHQENDFRQLADDSGRLIDGYPVGWLDKYRERWELLTQGQSDRPGTLSIGS